ncbi:MAG: UPF0158 family protein [Candidatus Firestonebacteria bacterium]
MPVPRKVEVCAGELISAFQDCSMEQRYFLDIEKGEIAFILEETMDTEKIEKTWDEIDSNPGRFIAIPERFPNEGYKEMVDFADTVIDKQLQEKLYITLNGKGAFRRFKDVLYNYPEEQNRWHSYRDEKAKERIHEWLEENKLEMEGI